MFNRAGRPNGLRVMSHFNGLLAGCVNNGSGQTNFFKPLFLYFYYNIDRWVDLTGNEIE